MERSPNCGLWFSTCPFYHRGVEVAEGCKPAEDWVYGLLHLQMVCPTHWYSAFEHLT